MNSRENHDANAFSNHSDKRTQIPHRFLQDPRISDNIPQPQHRRHRNPKADRPPLKSRNPTLGRLHFVPLRHLDPQPLPQPILRLNAQRLDGRPERHAHFCFSNPVDSKLRPFFLLLLRVVLVPVVSVGTIGHTARPPRHRHNLQVRIAPPIILLIMLVLVEYMHAFLLEKTSHRRMGFPVVDYFPLTAHGEGEGGCFEEDGEELRLQFWWWGVREER